ncbi:MAG: RNA polymerase sigma factor [Phycisphaerales bacterium]
MARPFRNSRSDDQTLIRRCAEGRQDAWDALVARYERLVYSVPRRYGLDPADAEDVAQATFVQLFRRLETLRDESSLASWLITTAHRESWRVGRRRPTTAAHLAETIPDVGTPDPVQAAAWERAELVRRALDELGGRCRDLLRLLFSADRPDYSAIAGTLGIAIGSIGPTRARCFAKLMPILDRLGLTPDGPGGATVDGSEPGTDQPTSE